MAIKLLIVDDEQVIRCGIASSVDWGKLDIEIVGEASNGRDGFSKALIMKPDIILSDVKMPVMDGIQMAKQIKEKLPRTRIVMLSGYRDFQFTREAFKAGAVDYLLKPVSIGELTELMVRICSEMRSGWDKEKKVQDSERLLHRARPVLRWEFFARYLSGEMSELQFRQEGQTSMQFHLGGPYYQVLVMDYDDFYFMNDGKEASRLLLYALSNIAEEVLKALGENTICYMNESSLVVLLSIGKQIRLTQVVEYASQIQFYIVQYFKKTVTVGVGACVEGVNEIRQSFAQARRAADGRVIYGKNRVITYEQMEAADSHGLLVLEQGEEHVLREQIRLLKPMEVQECLNRIFEDYFATYKEKKAAQQFCILLVSIALQEMKRMKVDPDQVFSGTRELLLELERYETLAEMRMWVKNVYSRIVSALSSRQSSQFKGIVKRSMEYAMEHYAEKLKVADLAEIVYVTPNYLSKVFKEETGENFTEWLNKYRVEKAKERMMEDPEGKAYQIAREVGFQDYKYFTYIFKKYTGYSPANYKHISG